MNFGNPSFSFPNHYASAVLRLYNKQKQVRFLFTFALVLSDLLDKHNSICVNIGSWENLFAKTFPNL